MHDPLSLFLSPSLDIKALILKYLCAAPMISDICYSMMHCRC